MTPTPTLSVIIPAFDAVAMIGEAIASIRAEDRLAEIVVVDDGSTDATAAVAADLADVVLRQVNRGPAAARNAGVAAARASTIAFLDADDLWAPGRVRRQRDLMAAAGCEVVVGYTAFRARAAAGGWNDHPRPQLLFSLGAALIARSAFERAGAFDETLRRSEDLEWFLRARDRGVPIQVHPEVVQYVRRHGANATLGLDLRQLRVMEVLKQSIDRRRILGVDQRSDAPAPDRPERDPSAEE